MREIQALEQEFPEAAEVTVFVGTVVPLSSLAMGLRVPLVSDAEFARQAATLKARIIAVMDQPAQHLGIRRIQEILQAHADRLYHWAEDRRIPADNNLAERDLRPTVIARKVSFGSPSDAGARTRGILMSVRHTLKQRTIDAVAHRNRVLDPLARDRHRDPFPRRCPNGPT